MRDVVLLPWTEGLGDAVDGLDVAIWTDEGPEPAQDVLDDVVLYVPAYQGGDRALEAVARMPRLRTIQCLWAGVDSFWPYVPEGVALHNAAGVHDASTAELALALMLARLRHLDDFARQPGAWIHEETPALADRRVLIVGYGSIGKAIERRLAGFEVDVVRVARSSRDVDGPDGPIHVHAQDELPSLLPDADVVVLITPLTAQTRGLVDAAFLARMKDHALLVNVSRGAVVATDALTAEVRSGRLQAALDVTDPEPLPPDHELWRLPGVLISPHVGGTSTAFEPRARRLVADQLRRWRAGEPLDNEVARP
ncbi:MAG TPA: 2-hydroxyacid dehydrogenase [Candidatus Nanopelagicales bacterium]|nr:2-hydroxyacid dehydrogenase [Candidatus Nanopelagicales bacterium]